MKNQNKTFRNFNKDTTKKLNTLRDLYNLENTALVIDLITAHFFEVKKDDILEKFKQKENEIFGKNETTLKAV